MTRWTLLKNNLFSLKIHCFRRGDEEMHDHPWSFLSVVLWRGYTEETPEDDSRPDRVWSGSGPTRLNWRGFLSVRYHPAYYAHRVIVDKGREAWTICLTFGRQRIWGFLTPQGWIQHDDYRRRNGREKVIV